MTAADIIESFLKHGWQGQPNPFEQMLMLKDTNQAEMAELVRLGMKDLPRNGTFVDSALSFVSQSEFESLVDDAVALLHQGPNEVAESVISYASLQFPELLVPYLRSLYSLRPNESTYYSCWPWRYAGNEEVDFLLEQIHSSPENREFAFECLASVQSESASLAASKVFEEYFQHRCDFNAYANLAGFEIIDGGARRLVVPHCYHIIFKPGYFELADKPSWRQQFDPTWTLDSEDAKQATFGGVASGNCGCCGGDLHRLINAPQGTISENSDVTIATCLSCLGWVEHTLFFVHNDDGLPTPLKKRDDLTEPDFPADPFPETTIKLVPTPPRWRFQDWALSNSRENLNRIGGMPSWVQDSEYPDCPKCSDKMKFCAQFDSGLPEGEWLWGSGGIAYAFWCEPCRISGMHWQCT